MNTVSIVLQLILCLSILVVLHECGHFFPAKWFKTRVEKFYLFFNPWFSLYKVQKGETEYGIGWIPFGGYVKIAGMIDESMDKDQMKGPVQPWEFRAKPAWQRLIIMVGGVVVNFILGFLLFAMIFMVWGKEYVKTEDVKYGISVGSIGEEMGLKDGDVILKVGDYTMDRFNPGMVVQQILIDGASQVQVRRDDKILNIGVSPAVKDELSKSQGNDFIGLRQPLKVKSVKGGTEAEKINLEKDGTIIEADGKPIAYFHELSKALDLKKGEDISLKLVSASGDTLSRIAKVTEQGTLGFQPYDYGEFMTVSHEKYSLFKAIPAGVKEGINFLSLQLKAFKKMFTGELDYKISLGSIISVSTLFDPSWDWHQFWYITATLSIILGFFNILPIPALDGGYVVFLIYEMITGKAPSDKFMEVVNVIGFILLISLMIFALGLDISRFFR